MTTLAATNAQVVIGGVTATYCTQFLKALGDNPTWKPTKLVSGKPSNGLSKRAMHGFWAPDWPSRQYSGSLPLHADVRGLYAT
jgi:hypothetical protein